MRNDPMVNSSRSGGAKTCVKISVQSSAVAVVVVVVVTLTEHRPCKVTQFFCEVQETTAGTLLAPCQNY